LKPAPVRPASTTSGRRLALRTMARASLLLLLAGLLWPLRRFVRHRVAPKPRLVTIPRPTTGRDFVLHPEFILFLDRHPPYAVSRTCTHLGCKVQFIEEEGRIVCPCHQSRFSRQGVYLSGPAKKDLPTYPVRVLQDEAGRVQGYQVRL